MIDTIVDGTRRVLEVARESGAGAFLFTSSGAIYGRLPAGFDPAAGIGVPGSGVREDFLGGPDPLDPGAAYHEAKRLAELLCAIALAPDHDKGMRPRVEARS